MSKNSFNISVDEFLKVDIRKGEIIDAQNFPEARKPAYRLSIDFGDGIGIKKSSAQITDNYKIDDLIGSPVLAVVNLPPIQVGPFISEVLTLGFSDKFNKIILVEPPSSIKNGGRLH
tara:strand:- start:117 stop:467 length:351 start_codon:yes stop_codon:yes gene_type:complete